MNVPITPQQLPSGFCPPDFQTMWNGFAAAGLVSIPNSVAQVIWQQSKPTDTTVTWGQLDALGRPVRLYRFAQGAWLSMHPMASGLTMWWFAVLPNFTIFDGGDANTLSDISGPMWQQALDSNGNQIAAKFPMPAGTLPSGTVLQLGNTGGEEKHSLLPAEMPPHTHFLANPDSVKNTISGNVLTPTNYIAQNGEAGGSDNNLTYQLAASATVASLGLSSNAGGTGTPPAVASHNTLPPYVVGYLLQRTARLFYAVN